MSDETGVPTPPAPPYNDPPPPPPGGSAPPPPPPSSSAGGGSDKTPMLIMAYLWILSLVPLLVEKEDREVQWHAKNGLVLLAAEFILYVVIFIVSMIPVVGCVTAILPFLIFPLSAVLRIVAIVKATKGERFIIPGISQYADRF